VETKRDTGQKGGTFSRFCPFAFFVSDTLSLLSLTNLGRAVRRCGRFEK
jgi:hypothetical protein